VSHTTDPDDAGRAAQTPAPTPPPRRAERGTGTADEPPGRPNGVGLVIYAFVVLWAAWCGAIASGLAVYYASEALEQDVLWVVPVFVVLAIAPWAAAVRTARRLTTVEPSRWAVVFDTATTLIWASIAVGIVAVLMTAVSRIN
jgi:hypothetical protein